MNRDEAQKQIADIMYHALKGDITEKEMHKQTFDVLKELDKVRLLKRDCPNCKTQFDKYLKSCPECKIEFGEHYL